MTSPRMEMFTVVLVVVLPLMGTAHKYPFFHRPMTCPPARAVLPCVCEDVPRFVMRCEKIYSLEDVRKALGPNFKVTLPSIRFNHFNVLALPARALGNVSAAKLRFNGGNIREIDEDAFVGQDDLKLLELSKDRLFDIPQTALAKLPHLQSLSLTGNLLAKVERGSFAGLDGLKTLILQDNRIARLEEGAFPPSITTLSISNNQLTTLNHSLVPLTGLEWLFVAENKLASLDGELDTLVNLEFLVLRDNLIRDLGDSLKNLGNLHVLNLAENKLYGLRDSLDSLDKLVSLNLSYNFLNFFEDRMFSHMRRLEILDLSGNQMFTVGFSFFHKPQLVYLNLSNNEIDSDVDLRGLNQLRTLDLSHNRLSSVDSVGSKNLPQLHGLYLQDNRLTSLPIDLKNISYLTDIDVTDNLLTTLHEYQLERNGQLRELHIGGNPWICNNNFYHALRTLAVGHVNIYGKNPCYTDKKP